ncbi:hypothetical protein HDU76_009674, partial [Blyttiomyces sp. JEL0837]
GNIKFGDVLEHVCLYTPLDSPTAISTSEKYTVTDSESDDKLPTARISFDIDRSSSSTSPSTQAKPSTTTTTTTTSRPRSKSQRQHEQPTLPVSRWSLQSKTTPPIYASALPPGSNVALESVRLLESDDDGGERVLALCTILVRNVSYEKTVRAIWSGDAWKSSRWTRDAKWVASVSRSMGGVVGIDRFQIEIEIDTRDTSVVQVLGGVFKVEFAIQCAMGGEEFWDNRGGLNHHLVVKEASRLVRGSPAGISSSVSSSSDNNGMLVIPEDGVPQSPSVARPALDLDPVALKSIAVASRHAAAYAARMGAAAAAEAARINAEFEAERRRGGSVGVIGVAPTSGSGVGSTTTTMGYSGRSVQLRPAAGVASSLVAPASVVPSSTKTATSSADIHGGIPSSVIASASTPLMMMEIPFSSSPTFGSYLTAAAKVAQGMSAVSTAGVNGSSLASGKPSVCWV